MAIVSACLAGVHCRFDCASKERADIVEMVRRGEAIPVCPEQMGGLTTPRPPAEHQTDGKVRSNLGEDVTDAYEFGAQEAVKMALLVGAKTAYLKSKSPMCGVGEIYDGSFSGKLIKGDGTFAKLLRKLGIDLRKID